MGEHVRRRRKERGLAQRESAKELHVSLATLRNWEAGRAKVGERYYRRVVGFLGHDPNRTPRSLPERIRAARLALGLSQKGLALRLGLVPSTVRAWELGQGESGHERVRQALQEFVEEAEET
jgi:transcriptional regulator with XRE-family HTH domain